MAASEIITDFQPVKPITDFKPVKKIDEITDFQPVKKAEENVITDFKPVKTFDFQPVKKADQEPLRGQPDEFVNKTIRTIKEASRPVGEFFDDLAQQYTEFGNKHPTLKMPADILAGIAAGGKFLTDMVWEDLNQLREDIFAIKAPMQRISGDILRQVEKQVLKDKKTVIKTIEESKKFIDVLYKHLNKFESSETETLFESTQGIKKENIFTKLKNVVKEIGQKFSRTYEHLPNTTENTQLINDLKVLQKQKAVAADTAARNITKYYGQGGKGIDDTVRRKVIIEDLINDVERGLYEEKELPFKFTKESLYKENEKLDKFIEEFPILKQSLKIREETWNNIQQEYIKELKPYKSGVEDMFKEKYFRHQVLDYIENNGIYGSGKKLKAPKRGYEQARTGSAKLYNTDFLEAEHQVMTQMLYDIELGKTLTKINKTENITKIIKSDYTKQLENIMEGLGHTKEQLRYGMKQNNIPDVAYINTLKSKIDDLSPGLLKKKNLDDWHKLIPDTHIVWQPKEGNIFYPAMTIKENTLEKIMSQQFDDFADITQELQKVIAIGGKRKEWVVRKEVAQTLDNLVKERTKGIISTTDLELMRRWKQWQLISPRRYFKYNIRNLSGDTESTFLGNPSGFTKVPQAIRELGSVYFKKGELTSDMKEWFSRGGMGSTLQAQEMDSLKKSWAFINQYEKKGGILKPFKAYWKYARLSTDFREAILRYANFLDYKEQLLGGKLKNYGASKPQMIDALRDINDKAFNLANDLSGAYDRVSVAGQTIRERLFPFWSWQEVNAKRYIQLYKNAANDGKLALTIGKKLGYKTPVAAMRIGKLAIKTAAFTSMLHVYNHTVHPELESQLSKDIQTTPHIILGKDKDGNIEYFNRLGTLDDFLSWFGLDYAPRFINEYLNGKKDLKELFSAQAEKTYQAPINKVIGGGIPLTKLALEIAGGRALFPDVFKPGTIRDQYLHIARAFGLENEYRALAGLPSRGYGESLKNLIMYRVDPGEAAYRDIYDMKTDFLKKRGKTVEGFWLTPTGDALYNMKLAIKYEDKKAFSKYFNQFIDCSEEQMRMGNIANIVPSILQGMHPLSGMNLMEQGMFLKSLSEDERKIYDRAMDFYKNTLSTLPEQEWNIKKK